MDASQFRPGPRADVHVERDGDRPTLVFERRLRHAPDRVWAALTDPDQLKEWSPFTADRNLARTGPATLRMIDGDQFEDLPGSVTRVEPPTLLEYSWASDVLVWQLEADGPGTRLTLRHTVQSDDLAPKVAAGWHLCLDVAELMMDGTPIGPIVGASAMDYGWSELHEAYTGELGIEPTPLPEEHQARR